jgi:uncharacterized membrane protein
MKNKLGVLFIGVVVLAGVGYYFYNKSKSPITNVTTAINVFIVLVVYISCLDMWQFLPLILV